MDIYRFEKTTTKKPNLHDVSTLEQTVIWQLDDYNFKRVAMYSMLMAWNHRLQQSTLAARMFLAASFVQR